MAYFDQLRYILGVLGCTVILCHDILSPRPRYLLRLIVGCTVSAAAAILRVPLWHWLARFGSPFLLAPYWLVMSFLPMALILFCYETNAAGALFRAMLASFVENFTTAIAYHLFVICLFPGFPEAHPALYALITLCVYGAVLFLTWRILRRMVRKDESADYPTPRSTAGSYLLTYLIFVVLISTDKHFCEFVIQPLGGDPTFSGMYKALAIFLTSNLMLISAAMTVIMLSAYGSITLRAERQIIIQMAKDREAQYELSRENIEMINRKAHDLKHQLRALELASDDERREQLRQTRETVDFYDAVVKTGNPALDTLLTEKSVYCQNRSIRLSCIVNTKHLDRIGVVDLYTLLGNAIDNAIEAVEPLEDLDKKTISLTIRDQGQMIFFHIENYYDGRVVLERGMPLTRKRDKRNHGYGVKSIQLIAKRYGGSVQIQAEDHIFSLEVLLPT